MLQLFKKMFETDGKNYSLLILRISAAVVMFPHGAQKMFGWFGGHGFEATVSAFSSYMGIPPVLSVLSILAESAGSLFLLLGLFSRISAFGLAVTMIVAALTSHMQYGFFMNWSGTAPGEGFEFHILYIAIALAVLMKGAGAFAIDSILAERINGRKVESLKLQSIH